ncbi:MAG: 5-amino-6-(D-ribitylamino)uracil--L-tyrosine 4-hydroxyphenyl transferase CofH [SAR324 cluster bacterium]|nr:5-amino-6-(D-ribitylamino)uracil--L-tyrosine 4-hydroxyphenyl transferase CofH [SAR324 cluster bacterium]
MPQLFDSDSAVPSSETFELRDDGRSASAALEGEVDAILDKALGGGEITVDEGARLFDATGDELTPLLAAADRLRREAVGDAVTYVVNRNINFTNVCVKQCGFCAFSRGHRADEGYYLPDEEVLRRAKEAVEMGATEVCVQAGLAPGMDGWHYVDLLKSIKAALPGLHVHAFSPEEVLYGSGLAGVSVAEYLAALKEAGIGSLPGTSAEILVDEVRDLISPGRITTAQWLHLIRTAHELGIPTTSTMMYGHLETAHHKALHLSRLRELQKETGGFTEFVPLGFIADEAPMHRKRRPKGLRSGPSGIETLKMYAVSRIMLHGWIHNIQVSWVKEGLKLGQVGLMAGANDLGGTLINESISTAAGSGHGQLQTPSRLRAAAREMGRLPVERDTLYHKLHIFDDPAADPQDPLDSIDDAASLFGSYHDLIQRPEHRFKAHLAQAGAERKISL